MKVLHLLVVVWVAVPGHSYSLLGGKIVGGNETTIEEYPYQSSVRIYDQHICGGSILDENTVLTAAHCVYGENHSKYSIRVGATNHNEGQSIKVQNLTIHNLYNRRTSNYDIAVLKLASKLIFSDKIQPIAVQPEGIEVLPGTIACVSGWGVTSEGSSDVPAKLRAVDTAVISNFECSKNYATAHITSKMLCARTLNHDSCQGDSGGPLVANGKLIGVVSWGYGCARLQYPGVYVKVASMYSWIASHCKVINK